MDTVGCKTGGVLSSIAHIGLPRSKDALRSGTMANIFRIQVPRTLWSDTALIEIHIETSIVAVVSSFLGLLCTDGSRSLKGQDWPLSPLKRLLLQTLTFTSVAPLHSAPLATLQPAGVQGLESRCWGQIPVEYLRVGDWDISSRYKLRRGTRILLPV